jgi:hypothetical protein
MKGSKRKPTPGSEPPAAEAPELPERWSAPRKTELVLRLLRGEALDEVSRESQVPAHEPESWKRVFLEQGTRGLRIRGEPERAHARPGQDRGVAVHHLAFPEGCIHAENVGGDIEQVLDTR